MLKLPEIKVGIVAVSRDCFPVTLSKERKERVVKEYGKGLYNCSVVVENEKDVLAALEELKRAEVNALVVYLGNFGPEAPETMLAQKFGGPVMFAAAAEESKDDLFQGRGDAYCGMLNASYNLNLRGIRAYIPEYPVGTASEVAAMIRDFSKIARAIVGVKKLKVFSFGPRPKDFFACNAPIKALYDLGVEIEENSELDLFEAFNAHKDDKRIPALVAEMEGELGEGNCYPGILPKLAQYEITLLDWYESHLGASEFGVFANKGGPAFQTQFGFVPCYVNGRLAARGIPVACETDIYGALTEFILECVSDAPAMLLDINNTVPADLAKEVENYRITDLFMGFHCGNGSPCLLKKPKMKYQLIMKRSLEPDGEPDITRGTLEGEIADGKVTLFRLQSGADTRLKAYVAEGEVLDLPTHTFGTVGVFAVHEMGRFYRHVLIENNFPHHAGVARGNVGKALFEVLKLLGVANVGTPRPANCLYPDENPF